jgi:hypothetical protein
LGSIAVDKIDILVSLYRFITEKRTKKTITSYNWRLPSTERGIGSLCPCEWLECNEITVEEHTRHEKELAPSYFSLGCCEDYSEQVVLLLPWFIPAIPCSLFIRNLFCDVVA